MRGEEHSRVSSFDIAKGIGMLCIIGGNIGVPVVYDIVVTFHLPLFFLICGCLYRKPKPCDELQTLKKRASRLLLPYVGCAVFCCLGDGARMALTGSASHGSWSQVAKCFISALYGSGSLKSPSGAITSFGVAWILLALFWALMLYDAVCEKKWTTYVVCTLFAIGVTTTQWWLPLSIQPGLCGVLFVHLGHIAKERNPESLGRGVVPFKVAVGALVVWVALFMGFAKCMSLARCYFPCMPVDIIRAVAGTLVVVWLSDGISRIPLLSAVLETYGKYSSTALCFHMFDRIVMPWKELADSLGLLGGMSNVWWWKTLLFVLKVMWSAFGIALIRCLKNLITRPGETSCPPTSRMRLINMASGIVVLLLVIADQTPVDPVLRRLVFSFQIPFFFLMDAVLIAGCYDVRRMFRQSLRAFVLPYVVACLLMALLKALVTTDYTKLAVLGRLQIMAMGLSSSGDIFVGFSSVSLVWFLACLFVAHNIYVISRRLTARCHPFVTYLMVISLCAAGWWLGSRRFYLPWSADVALFAQLFMLIGDEVGKCGLLKKMKPTIAAAMLVVFVWVALAMGGFQIEMVSRSYPGLIACIVAACAGNLIVYWLSVFFDDRVGLLHDRVATGLVARVLVWIGQNGIVLIVIHCLRRLWAGWTSSSKAFDPSLDWTANACIEILFCVAVCLVYRYAESCMKEMLRCKGKRDYGHRPRHIARGTKAYTAS